MPITDPLVLPADVLVVPVAELPTTVLAQLDYDTGDYAVTRPQSRTPSRIVDDQSAILLKEFRTPSTIVDAVIRYSRVAEANPETVLLEAFPMLQKFIEARMLVSPDSDEASNIAPCLTIGAHVGNYTVLDVVQVLEDTELYKVQFSTEPGGPIELGALKIARPGFGDSVRRMFAREAAILQSLDGHANPRMLAESEFEDRPYIVIEWCEGKHIGHISHASTPVERSSAVELACNLLEAYAHLHEQGVVHSDVHQRNVLVAPDGTIKVIDFGLARVMSKESDYRHTHRGGVGFFFEPELARAHVEGRRPPDATPAGEQYSLAALIYYLLTGSHYLEFSLDRSEMMRQIAEDPPSLFISRGITSWPVVEFVLTRALSKDPGSRFPSVAAFADALRAANSPQDTLDIPDIPDNQEVADSADSSQVLDAISTPFILQNTPLEALLDEVISKVRLDGPLLPAGLTRSPTASVDNGNAGIAYTLYRIALARNDSALLSLADVWITKAVRSINDPHAFYDEASELTRDGIGPISVYHTASGVHAVQALISQAMCDVATHQIALQSFISAAEAPWKSLDVTLGRAGVLLSCSLLLDNLPATSLFDGEPIREFGDRILQGIWAELDTYAPIKECRELPFLGIAHGWAGLLYATMRWSEASGNPLPTNLQERLEQLAECGEPHGRGLRWKRKLHKHAREQQVVDYVPGWCNGTAGFVHLWTQANKTFREPRYLSLAEKSGIDTWEFEDDTGDLCCGLAGRAYALLNLYKRTGSKLWQKRAEVLAQRAAQSIQSWATLRDSLYKGEPGVALLAIDLASPEGACMPLFERENWPTR